MSSEPAPSPTVPRISRTSNDELIFHRHGLASQIFSAEQLRLFAKFDACLRKGAFDKTKRSIPGGYDTFAELWNRNASLEYGYSTIDPITCIIKIADRPPVPIDELAPPRERMAPAKPEFTEREKEVMKGSVISTAAVLLRQQERIEARRAAKRSAQDAGDKKKKRKKLFGAVDPGTRDTPTLPASSPPPEPSTSSPPPEPSTSAPPLPPETAEPEASRSHRTTKAKKAKATDKILEPLAAMELDEYSA